MNNIQKCIVLLLTVMLLVPDSAWAQESKQEFVIKGVVEDKDVYKRQVLLLLAFIVTVFPFSRCSLADLKRGVPRMS